MQMRQTVIHLILPVAVLIHKQFLFDREVELHPRRHPADHHLTRTIKYYDGRVY